MTGEALLSNAVMVVKILQVAPFSAPSKRGRTIIQIEYIDVPATYWAWPMNLVFQTNDGRKYKAQNFQVMKEDVETLRRTFTVDFPSHLFKIGDYALLEHLPLKEPTP